MKLLKLTFLIACLSFSFNLKAQTAFWSYDANDGQLDIPLQCDGQFDETRGGVFLPTPDELYDYGESFLLEKGKEKNSAAYCFLSAALQGHVGAQYRLAQMYNKGIVFPQNDLAAYKWSFLAALHGHKKAEQMALTLEQLLSTTDIDMATQSIQSVLPSLTQKKTDSLAALSQELDAKKEKLEKINKEIDDMLGIKFVPPEIKTPEVSEDIVTEKSKKKSKTVHFTEKDRM